eukprot:3938332-Prorocentrum_lima.AAC.1
METKATQVHHLTLLCKNFMNITSVFYESLYDQLSDDEVFYYSDGPDLPPLQNNQVYSVTSTISDDAKQWNF